VAVRKKSRSFLSSGRPSGSIRSANDGRLGEKAPEKEAGQDDYTTDYTTSTGPQRAGTHAGADFHYLTCANDARADLHDAALKAASR